MMDHRGFGGVELKPHHNAVSVALMIDLRIRRPSEESVHRFSALLISAAVALWAAGCSAPGPVAEGVHLIVDGKKQTIRGAVSCNSHSAGDAVKVGKMPDGIYIHIAAELGGVITVEELDLGNSTGTHLFGADTTVTRQHDGSYHITGRAISEDKQDASASRPFELNVKCP
jgi:hypothetical protein